MLQGDRRFVQKPEKMDQEGLVGCTDDVLQDNVV